MIVMVGVASSASAAIVYLKDGGQLHGNVISSTAGDIQLHTPDGTLTISTDRIVRIDYSDLKLESFPADTSAPTPRLEPRPKFYAPPRERAVQYARKSTNEGRQFFSVDIGAAVPLSRVDFTAAGGGTDDNGNAGFLIGSQYLYRVAPHLGAGASFEYFNRGGLRSQGLLPDSETSVSGNSALLLGNLKFSLIDHGSVRPYMLGGIGANYTSTVIDARPDVGFGWSDSATNETRTLVDSSRWGLASTLRFGVDFSLSDPTVLGLELGWTHLSNGSYPATSAGKDLGLGSVSGNQNVLTFGLRWGWRF